ncbi:poly-beta-1,6-N-acetyl-D-glucosamine N-deacetylase PgaB [Lysobacter korlensis]|uniref:Poly-beta-1,6-N-acetyl-D-glucosamine N-deacetylase PgaB n=1 Tax=Lysobacter korlensis TaxID=553636 RepID=A0ABV6RLJ1_9GAMM
MRLVISALWALVLMFAAPLTAMAAKGPATEPLLVLSYHDIRDDVAPKGDADAFAVSAQNFAAHLDWLSGQGYRPVSLSQVIEASKGGAPLPPKPVLITFDDGLRSVYTKAFPLLRAYGYPALAAVVTDWVDLPAGRTVDYGPRPFTGEDFLTWDQLREMQASGLLEVASHSADLHRGVTSNPQGNSTPAAVTRIYDPAHGYESEAAYLARIRNDLARSAATIERELGRAPRAIVWPYAAYSDVTNEIADSLGMTVSFDLEGRSTPVTSGLHGLARLLLTNNATLGDLVYQLRHDEERTGVRALQIDLDAVYDADPAQLERNLDELVERVKRVGPTHVFLQAFADPDGNGSADALYFPNRFLPVRADLFNRVSWQLKSRAGVEVFGWLPVLGFEPADARMRQELAIRNAAPDEIFRLDFTRPEVRTMVRGIYEDLAVAGNLQGLLFHDDAYLRDTELTGTLAPDAHIRTQALIDFTLELERAAERWRPKLKTARNLYARTVLQPESEAWFAQRLDRFNAAYDYTAVMAMPWMEGSRAPERWLDGLVKAARRHDPQLTQTLFELQTLDWRTSQPIPGERLVEQVHRLLAQGVRHIGWYPDDFIGNRPRLEHAREAMSARSFPYEER